MRDNGLFIFWMWFISGLTLLVLSGFERRIHWKIFLFCLYSREAQYFLILNIISDLYTWILQIFLPFIFSQKKISNLQRLWFLRKKRFLYIFDWNILSFKKKISIKKKSEFPINKKVPIRLTSSEILFVKSFLFIRNFNFFDLRIFYLPKISRLCLC